MNEIKKCPVCEKGALFLNRCNEWECPKCVFACAPHYLPRIAAAMELARATRTLEDAMEPLNSGKLKMGEALPRIKLAMADQKACEERVLAVFEGGE